MGCQAAVGRLTFQASAARIPAVEKGAGDSSVAGESFKVVNSPQDKRATLTVVAEEVGLEGLEAFDESCQELLHTGQQNLVVDLSRLPRVHSGYIGLILYANSEAHLAGRKLEVIAGENVIKLLNMVAPGLIEIRQSS